jgi:hypothetical protein
MNEAIRALGRSSPTAGRLKEYVTKNIRMAQNMFIEQVVRKYETNKLPDQKS